MQNESGQIDVTVIGGGLAGMAASIHLADAGLRVVCIEADLADSDPVGDIDGSAEYKRKMVRVFVRRALRQALAMPPAG